jgi:hypothetical protein
MRYKQCAGIKAKTRYRLPKKRRFINIMIPIIGLLSTAGIIIGIYALFKGSAPRLGIKSRKVAAIILCVSFLFFIIAVSSDTPSDKATADEEPAAEAIPEELTTEPEETAAEEAEIITEAAKNAFLAWESEIMLIHARADSAMESFSSVLTELGEGNVDIYSTYNEAKRTRDTVNNAWRDLNRVELSDELSDDHKSRLNDAAFSLSTGLFVKVEGLDLILKFLDDPKPSYANEASGNFDRAYIYMIEGLSEITMIKFELGLLDELNDDE